MYRLLRNILFCFPPEWAHYFSMNCLRFLCRLGGSGWLRRIYRPEKTKPVTAFGIHFSNPIGLGAGFDKNARYLRELECLGFGFVEIGTVTPLPQAGNEKPRLFRLPKDKALINRMGFNNDGVEVIALRLKEWRESQEPGAGSREPITPLNTHSPLATRHLPLIIGGNIGKNKLTPNEEAWKDYEICFTALHPYVDYFVVNVSSPNTPGLRELQEKDSLKKILTGLQHKNASLAFPKPILLKIAPDLTTEQLDDVAELALEIQLDGLVVSNTTINRDGLSQKSKVKSQRIGPGGVSGEPLKKASTEVLRYICTKTDGKIPVIASGGIFTAADAGEKMENGATLLQVWTGFIYEGPGIVKKISRGLLDTQHG